MPMVSSTDSPRRGRQRELDAGLGGVGAHRVAVAGEAQEDVLEASRRPARRSASGTSRSASQPAMVAMAAGAGGVATTYSDGRRLGDRDAEEGGQGAWCRCRCGR